MRAFFQIILLALVIVMVTMKAFPQSFNVDSLWIDFRNAEHDTTRIILLNERIGHTYRKINPDSAILFYNQAITIADNAIGSSVPDENNRIFFFLKANSLRYIGISYYLLGKFQHSIDYFLKSLKISEELEDKMLMFQCFNNIGVIHSEQGNYDSAIEHYNKSLSIADELGDKRGISLSLINIGNIYYFQKQYEPAIEYYFKNNRNCGRVRRQNTHVAMLQQHR